MCALFPLKLSTNWCDAIIVLFWEWLANELHEFTTPFKNGEDPLQEMKSLYPLKFVLILIWATEAYSEQGTPL